VLAHTSVVDVAVSSADLSVAMNRDLTVHDDKDVGRLQTMDKSLINLIRNGIEVVLVGRDKFRAETFLVIVNQLVISLRGRVDAYKEVRNVFRVITDLDVLDADQIRELPLALAKKYVADLEPGVFPEI